MSRPTGAPVYLPATVRSVALLGSVSVNTVLESCPPGYTLEGLGAKQ